MTCWTGEWVELDRGMVVCSGRITKACAVSHQMVKSTPGDTL